jgi:hypothetical protein
MDYMQPSMLVNLVLINLTQSTFVIITSFFIFVVCNFPKFEGVDNQKKIPYIKIFWDFSWNFEGAIQYCVVGILKKYESNS